MLRVFITSKGFPVQEPITPDVAPAANFLAKGASGWSAPINFFTGP